MAKSRVDDVLGSLKARGSGSSEVGRNRQQRSGSKLRTVVKGRFRTLTPKGRNPGLGRASAVMRNLDYMTTRPDHEHKHRISRDLITPEGRVNMQAHPEVRQKILDDLAANQAKYVYHLVLSSGDKRMTERETELWAKAVLSSQGINNYLMAVHAGDRGHTENPHVHVVFPSEARLERGDFFDMRKVGDVEQQFHMRLYHQLEESWKEKFGDQSAGSGGFHDPDEEERQAPKRKDIDIHFG